MRIGIDIRVLTRGTRTGVEEYTINLLDHLLPLDSSVEYKLFYNAYHQVKLDYDWLNLPNVKLYSFRLPNRIFFVLARYLKFPQIDRLLKGVDVYFSPHFFPAPVSSYCRRVITFHDLSFEHHPQFFNWRKRLWQKFLMETRKEAEKADKIIAVSESTKKDLIDIYGIEPKKIKVIYSGISLLFNRQPSEIRHQSLKLIKKKYNLPDKFILYFGTLEPRKNLIGLIKAFELLNSKFKIKNFKLVLAGSKGWLYQEIFKTVQKSFCRDKIVFTGFIKEEDKPYIYQLAELFVYPSFFEGFGFPPLEAMTSGVPTIVSCNSSLPEVVEQAAVMVDPYNIQELAWAMKIILTDKNLREELIKKGFERAKQFSWQKCAQETLEILKEVRR